MGFTRFLLVTACVFLWPSQGHADSASAQKKGLEIATKVDNAYAGFKGSVAKVDLELYSAAGDKVVRTLVTKIREASGDGDQSIMTIKSPPDVRDVRLLTWAHLNKDDDRWLYMPSLKRVKRISARGKTGSFMGSEFTYEDLTSFEVPKYTYRFLGDQKVDGRPVWVVERTPRDRSGYKKHVVFVDKEYVAAVRIAYFDRRGTLLKTATMDGYKKYEGRWWRPGRVEMVNRQTGKKSVFVFKNWSLNKNLSSDEFSPKTLSN